MVRSFCALALAAAIFVLGCGTSNSSFRGEAEKYDAASRDHADQVQLTSGGDVGTAIERGTVADERKVIFRGTMEMEVADLSAFEQTLVAQLETVGGFVVNFQEDRSAGSLRHGRWVLRIPSSHFRTVVDTLSAAGVARSRQIDAQDVTEEFVDLAARLAAKRKYYARIEAIVDGRQGNIEEIVRLEAELQKIQEEVERLQGRLTYLQNHTSFSTLSITAREEQPFVARTTPEFGDRFQTAWQDSWAAVRACGEWLAVTGAASAPWAAVFGPLVGLTYAGARRWRRRGRKE